MTLARSRFRGWYALLFVVVLAACGSDDGGGSEPAGSAGAASGGVGGGGSGGDAGTSGGAAGALGGQGGSAAAAAAGTGGGASGTAGAAGGGSGGGSAVTGIWTSASELANKPMSGSAWTTLLGYADGDTTNPDVSNQDDPTNVRVLAAAIVYARSGDAKYKTKVTAACDEVIGTEKGGRSLAWGREAGAYAIAAELVGHASPEFSAWLKNVADGEKCSQLGITLRQMFEKRPNNWGSMAFGSLTAIYRFLGDDKSLEAVKDYWIQGVTGPNPGFVYGDDLSWHPDSSDLRMINPKGATKQGVNVDGIIPDDMRRGGSFTTGTPVATGYPWEHLQGVLMGARILERAGMPIWDVDDQAIYRAAHALEVRIGGSFVCAGDDLWQLAFLDAAYGTSWSQSKNVWGAGKNAGFAYVVVP